MTDRHPMHAGQVLTGSLFSEPMNVVTVKSASAAKWILGLVGVRSERFRSVTRGESDLDSLTILGGGCTFDGDARFIIGAAAYAGLSLKAIQSSTHTFVPGRTPSDIR